jgi:glycosyltransferase involved in cell wall biosynthesis
MADHPLISVIVPSYYHEAYIDAAICSVLAQDWVNLELIVIDDGSKDRSLQRLARYRDKRLQVITQPNGGAHSAINRGLHMAQGDYLTILNSDDVFAPNRLSRLHAALQRDGADMAVSWIQQIDHNGVPGSVKKAWQSDLPGWAALLGRAEIEPAKTALYELVRSNYISTTSNLMVSRKLYETVRGIRNLRFAHDWDFALRAATRFPMVVVPEVLLFYRTHGTNTIRGNRGWMLFEICWVLAANMPSIRPALPELSDDDLHKSHFGSLEPIFAELVDAMNRDRAEGRKAGMALLDDADARQAFIARISA